MHRYRTTYLAWIWCLTAGSSSISALATSPNGLQRPVTSYNCSAQEPEPADPNANYGYIHEIVGKDGALMLALRRNPKRVAYSVEKLKEAGIIVTKVPAADGVCEAEEDLTRGCLFVWNNMANETAVSDLMDTMQAKHAWGWGCSTMARVGCTESHHRAMELATYRKSDWTLIMEDDVVPVDPAAFDRSFKAVWPKVPAWAKLVRLGFCAFTTPDNLTTIDTGFQLHYLSGDENEGDFRIVHNISLTGRDLLRTNTRKYDAGMCMTAYMVHRSALPDMLGMFPCPCIIDCCFTGGLMNKPAGPKGESWGELNMVTIDINLSAGAHASLRWHNHQGMIQYGPLVQDNRGFIVEESAPTQASMHSVTSKREVTDQELERRLDDLSAFQDPPASVLEESIGDLASEISALRFVIERFS